LGDWFERIAAAAAGSGGQCGPQGTHHQTEENAEVQNAVLQSVQPVLQTEGVHQTIWHLQDLFPQPGFPGNDTRRGEVQLVILEEEALSHDDD